ncbi:uncharacterized protein BDV17DRAFT_291262 [Aspergillus undulatus]|uniref:uncharacterized protein n=1 Tax=Aspergillus undulatus TaxID=1810928 RepID=UPI003CCDF8AF
MAMNETEKGVGSMSSQETTEDDPLPYESVYYHSLVLLQTIALWDMEGAATATANAQSASQSDQIFSFVRNLSTQATDWLSMTDGDETSTVYWDTMTIAASTEETYVTELFEQLLYVIPSHEPSDETVHRMTSFLPDYLRAFALRFGSYYNTVSQAQ